MAVMGTPHVKPFQSRRQNLDSARTDNPQERPCRLYGVRTDTGHLSLLVYEGRDFQP